MFIGLAVAEFKRNPWLFLGAFAGHRVLHFFHDAVVNNAGAPRRW